VLDEKGYVKNEDIRQALGVPAKTAALSRPGSLPLAGCGLRETEKLGDICAQSE
jgi:hypothetical protein